jgi:hypothetical protein
MPWKASSGKSSSNILLNVNSFRGLSERESVGRQVGLPASFGRRMAPSEWILTGRRSPTRPQRAFSDVGLPA